MSLTDGYLDYMREISKEDVKILVQNGEINKLYTLLEEWLEDKQKFEYVDILINCRPDKFHLTGFTDNIKANHRRLIKTSIHFCNFAQKLDVV